MTEELAAALSDAERAVDDLLADAHLAAPHELPELIATHARRLGVEEALVYVVDLQQHVLVPFLCSAGPGADRAVEALPVDSTVAGRAFQLTEVLSQDAGAGRRRLWLPLLDGTERLGVLAVTVPAEAVPAATGGPLGQRLRRFASLVAELIVTKSLYGDTIVRLRRRSLMGLAAELQWSLLPPMTFAGAEVTVAAALEPAYQIGGDTIDYAIDSGIARAAIFDGMGHGLASAQLAVLAVAAYRNARRSGRSLSDTVAAVDGTLFDGYAGVAFSTAIMAELDTTTGLLTWANAGHPAPLLLRGGKLVKTLRLRPTLPLGMRVAGRAPTAVTIGREQLEPDDRVLLYTDGVTEARSPGGEFFGEEALADLLTRQLATGLPSPETLRRLVRALLAHQQGQLSDDATLLLLEWRSANTGALLPTADGPVVAASLARRQPAAGGLSSGSAPGPS